MSTSTRTQTRPRDLAGVTLAFDLDGTLIDTAPDLIATAHAILKQNGFAAVDDTVLRPEISFGSRAMLARALKELGAPADIAQLDAMFDQFLVRYKANIAEFSQPFPNVVDVIDRARRDGAKVVVCTNKLEGLSRALLTALDLTDRFDAIAGRDTYSVYKPDPGHLLNVVAAVGGNPDRAVMVGDSGTDVKTAKAAGVPVIGVTFGYTDVPIQALDCDAVIESYDAFDDALAEIMAKPSV